MKLDFVSIFQISRYEETLNQLQADLDRSQDNYRKAHAEVGDVCLGYCKDPKNLDPLQKKINAVIILKLKQLGFTIE